MTQEMPLVSAQVISVRYRSVVALDEVSLELGTGVTGLVGENGAGKTSLLRCLSGAQAPASGSISVAGHSLGTTRGRRAAQRVTALMPQLAKAPRSLSALDFVTYVTWMRGVKWAAARQRAGEALEQVGLAKVATQKSGTLSGGMQRRVWLAQALAARPEVLLLDEPSTGLDPKQRATMVSILGRLSDTCVLLSSHILEDVAELAQRVIVLDEGVIRYDGPKPSDLDNEWFLTVVGAR